MSKKIDNINIPKEILKDLRGFEEVFEDYVDSENYKEQERKNLEKSSPGKQYELENFLELENARLTRLEIFLTKKISLQANFSQTEKLTLTQINKKKEMKEKLYKELNKSDSIFQKNLADFFNLHFS
jgi:hypothetical protein